MGFINFIEILRIRKELAYLTFRSMYSAMGVSFISTASGKTVRGDTFVNGQKV